MKSKKSLSNNFDFNKFFKPIGILAFCLVLVAGVIFAFFGFNKGFDFTGGTQLVVQFPDDDRIQTQSGLNETADKTKEILSKNGIQINSFQVQGEFYDKCFVITFQKVSAYRLYDARLELNAEFNVSQHYLDLGANEKSKILDEEGVMEFDITKNTTEIEGLISPTAVLATISTLIFALVVVMIYSAFRFKLASALSIVFAGAFNVLLTIAVVLIARIEINTYFFVCLGLVLAASVFGSTNLFYVIKQKIKDPMLTDKTNQQIANLAVSENFYKTVLTYGSALVLAVLVGIVGVLNVLNASLVVLLGLAVGFASQVFVVPAFWATINKKRELLKPTIVVETNDVDANAEVIEIDEEK